MGRPPGPTAPSPAPRCPADLEPIVPLVRVVHGPLVHVALNGDGVPGVLAACDLHPVAAASHPSNWPTLGNGHADGGEGRDVSRNI
jgi:hypothetical protein